MLETVRSIIDAHRRFLSAFVLLGALVLSVVACHTWMDGLLSEQYDIFYIRKTLSWRTDGSGYFRAATKKSIDNVLSSKDRWRSFDLSFKIKNLRETTVITHFYNNREFYFIALNDDSNVAVFGRMSEGKPKVLKPAGALLAFSENQCRLQVDPDGVRFFVGGELVLDVKQKFLPGKFGFLAESEEIPPVIFSDINVRGVLDRGLKVEVTAPLKQKFAVSQKTLFRCLAALLSIMGMALAAGWFFGIWFVFREFRKDVQEGELHVGRMTAVGIHLAVTAALFWPFLSRGSILISSYDNLGEILPLFFYTKHVFMDWFHGISSGLWCSLAHNGMPFYTSHWNMSFYPLHWPIFFAPDDQVLTWLTAKTMVEVFLIGIAAFGFFKRELRDDLWALICAVSYQMGSLLIFTITIFPTVSLFFAMTFYLYVVWSLPERRWIWNYILLTLAVYLMLTSANVAFVFYAGLSAAVLTVYRFWDASVRNPESLLTLVGGAATGMLIGAIRILPCLWGILNSNRLVADYFSIHDRFPLILRLFVPSISGWLGPDQLNVFGKESLGWAFDNINSQSGFFVYYGILVALLVGVSFAVKAEGRLKFWKWYGWGTLLFALLWKPVWGILSILFFPLNHFSYHTIILPVALCGLAGHVGCAITRGEAALSKIKPGASWVLAGFGCYAIVFLTYLFPGLTGYARVILLMLMGIAAAGWRLKRDRPQWMGKFYACLMTLGLATLAGVLFSLAAVLIVSENFVRVWLGEGLLWPLMISLFGLIVAGYWFLMCCRPWSWGRSIKGLGLFGFGILCSLLVMNSLVPETKALLASDDGIRMYAANVIIDLLMSVLMIFFCVGAGLFWQKKILPRGLIAVCLIGVVAADLFAFNLRFDNIAAPFGYKAAFYQKGFQYRDMEPGIREKLDLVNYRVTHQERVGLNANKWMVFDVPSYTGTMGYMPKRFAEFIHAFGVPEETILIYPDDAITNPRFMDLSSVRYVFEESGGVTTRSTALPRMSIFYQHDVVEDKDVLLNALSNERFDYQANVLLSRPPKSVELFDFPLKSEAVEINSSRPGDVAALFSAQYPALILFNESFDEGWKAYVDGKETEVLEANHNFMASPVPKGAHEIRFVYQPRKYFMAKTIHLIGVTLFFIVMGFSIILGMRKRKMLKDGPAR